ncbi:MAG: hypothetical protein HYU46_10445 [Deltaproteobacteria bacterium]|nr:hypothetical protein [Deltaproteobacteria bacterium]
MARSQKSTQPLTTAQRLSSIVKACRDIMRKDKGLNGDLDRLPVLTWIMFLKFLDDMEPIRSEEAKMSGKRFRHAIDSGDIIPISLAINRLPIDRLASKAAKKPTIIPIPTFSP